MHATDHLLSEKRADGTSVGFLGSVLGHVALFVALLLYSGLSQRPTLQAIPISIVSIGDSQNLHSQLSYSPEISSQPRTARPKRQPQFLISSTQVEHAPTPLGSTTAEAAASVGPGAFAENSGNVLNDRDTHVGLESPSPASGLDQAQQAKHLWNTAATANSGGTIDLVEQQSNEAPGLKITRRTEWQANPVEDNKLDILSPR